MKYPQLVSMPSAVSDWLEEQLEARGIDAVVYTRYVLSLLHTHTVDVIYPDEDLQFSRLKKEVRRSSGGRKRFRRSSDWWRHAQADAEQIKRSAAVECLMSASDQNCEIESLVDELCEKLKEVNSEPCSPSTNPDATSVPALKEPQKQKITPQELAEKYYAAFPPLCPQSTSKLISLLPKWKPATSPIKKKNVRKQCSRQLTYDNKLYSNGDTMKARNQNKSRFNYANRNKSGICRRSVERTDNINNWDLCVFNNNSKKGGGQKAALSGHEKLDQCVETNRDVWTNDDDEMNMYEDLPVDIKELLDSPSPQDDTVEMMNLANMRDNGKRAFIPYGTNIISSIWSNDQDTSYDNKFNASIDCTDSDSMLDFKFSSITIDNQAQTDSTWPSFNSISENEANSFFESGQTKKSLFLEGFRSLPEDWKKVEVPAKEECFENEHLLNHIAVSLMKINHNKEKSCFTEIIPRPQPVSKAFNPFSRTSMFSFNSRRGLGFERDKEDLLTSERSHFKPINEKVDNYTQSQYADGATFVISNSLDKVDYKRSESGSMMLENEYGQSKKYYEYKFKDPAPSPDPEFVLKFSICQNDKACQTEEVSELDFDTVGTAYKLPESSPPKEGGVEEGRCICPTDKTTATTTDNPSVNCLVHPARPESMLGEILWKYEVKTCEKCNNNNVTWNADWQGGRMDSEWDSQNLRNIWNGGEVCETCLSLNDGDGRPPPSQHNTQLREDISQDGEQLLSDLSSLQKSYMEGLPLAEISCDISELVSAAAPKERKRRHSYIAAHVDEVGLQHHGSWSFASRLEEDCLIQMSTLPTLRSVTL